jgi:hypothetical protein
MPAALIRVRYSGAQSRNEPELNLDAGLTNVQVVLVLTTFVSSSLAVALAFSLFGAAPGSAQPCDSGVVKVHVQLAALPGAAPPPGVPPPGPQPMGPAAGILVRVVSPEASGVAIQEQVADADGEVDLVLTPGDFWVLAPWTEGLATFSGSPVVAVATPDGVPVLAWVAVAVTPGSQTDVQLTVTVALP